MFFDPLKHRFFKLSQEYFARVAILFVLIGVPLLSSCTTPSPLDVIPIDLGIPTQAIKSPVIGPLPTSTKLHVAITFKVNQSIINSLDGQRIHPGQQSKLEQFANKIGIDDATYQKIKNFFNLKGIVLNLSKLHTHLTIDAKASTFAKLLQTHFGCHTELCVLCRASKYGNVAWLPYGHERTGNHQAKCEASRVLLTNQRQRAEQSQAVMRKGQKTHKHTPPPEPALKADSLLTSKY